MNLFIIGVISGEHILVIAVIILLLFGGSKIPELMKGLGQGMKEFRKATKEDPEDKTKDQGKLSNN